MNVVYWSQTTFSLIFFLLLFMHSVLYVYTDFSFELFWDAVNCVEQHNHFLFSALNVFFGSVLILHSSNYKFLLIRKQCAYGSIVAPRWTRFLKKGLEGAWFQIHTEYQGFIKFLFFDQVIKMLQLVSLTWQIHSCSFIDYSLYFQSCAFSHLLHCTVFTVLSLLVQILV